MASASWTWRRRRATLLDEGVYVASVSTRYRILRSVGEVRERWRQALHPPYVKPELVAEGPNRVWSWDITKLLGPQKWIYSYLYLVLDIFSRYVVGWTLATREAAELAERLLADSIRKQGVEPDQLTIHADRGSSMSSKPVALLLADLGVTKSHSRPHCSNDNPTRRPGSRRSSTGPSSRNGSDRRRTRGPSANAALAGTTTSTVTPASATTRPPTSTTAVLPGSARRGPWSWPASTPPTPSASCASRRRRPGCPAQPGSTSRHLPRPSSREHGRIRVLPPAAPARC